MVQFEYIIFYRVAWDGDVIEVLCVIDGKRVTRLKRLPNAVSFEVTITCPPGLNP
jgi:hypothetical protein